MVLVRHWSLVAGSQCRGIRRLVLCEVLRNPTISNELVKEESRNGKIDPYPPRIVKILCVAKEEFNRLKSLVRLRRKKMRRGLAPLLKNKKQSNIKIFDRKKDRVYEATNMAQAYDSKYWSWRRVNRWFKTYRDDYTMS